MSRLSFEKEKIKILLLEGIDPSASQEFYENGYCNVETVSSALDGKELFEKIGKAFILGIRSRTMITPEVLSFAPKLFAIGCFCIGTDQVALRDAALKGIPVFNAPHSNTRSVAELVLGLTIMLMRGIFEKNAAAHQGIWMKSALGSHEVRGKVMGIVGYGHIGAQVSVLAESVGMQVVYYDILTKLPLGNAKAAASLDELLFLSDIITVHVPDTKDTLQMIGEKEFSQMRPGSYLINASRGGVVDIDALSRFLKSGHIKGAALDVFPKEPKDALTLFESSLKGQKNAILTPHIGGSTEEAQRNIGSEVARKLIYYSDRGSSEGAVNFPAVSLPQHKETHRILHIHKNVPGMLQKINKEIADENINVHSQYLLTTQDVGYVVLDIEKKISRNLLHALQEIEGTIRSRVLY